MSRIMLAACQELQREIPVINRACLRKYQMFTHAAKHSNGQLLEHSTVHFTLSSAVNSAAK